MAHAAIALAPSQMRQNVSQLVQILGASLFIAVCAQIRIPLFFTPVPITLQTFAILLIGGSLGSKKGALAVMAYIAEAFFCLPVLTGASFGLVNILGPTGGYIVGFIVQAYLTGLFFERVANRTNVLTLVTVCGICFLELAIGCIWLANFVGWQSVFLMGFAPFIPGEILKSLAVVCYFKK